MNNIAAGFKNPRIIFAFTYDIFVTALTFWFAVFLRYETFDQQIVNYHDFNKVFAVTLIIFAISYLANGLYKGVWRFSSTYDLIRVIRSTAIGCLTSIIFWLYVNRMHGIPRSLFPIQFFLLIAGLGGGRFVYRYLKDRTALRSIIGGADDEVKNVLIIGAGQAGEKLVRDIHSTPNLKLNIVGLIDDDKFKKNALIHNVKVYGDCSAILGVCEKTKVDKIFIAIPSATGDQVKKIVSFCKVTNAEIKILPKMDHLLSSQVEISLLRNLNIEDLLGREQVKLDTAHLNAMLNEKIVLVTGAGGSIGSELCFQIAKFKPKTIIMADYCELFMYELEMKFKELHPDIGFFPKILDIRNLNKVENTFAMYRPQIVFHAAAYKHVPMMEYNPCEAVETNIKGTKTVAEMALKYGADKFIMISTDKAVNPTNVMGASKRIAEMVISECSKKSTHTQFISVRFGNVLGSNGSVIPLFRKQIEDRKDITVTHPDIIRYFMSIPEACQLVLQAGSMGQGGEIFVLDMGEPVKIVDLAKEMIRLAGLELDRDINIVYTGLRPGEKLFEELFSDKEAYEITHHGKIRKALYRQLDDSFEINLNRLIHTESTEPDVIVYLIKNLVPEFTHFRLNTEAAPSELS